MMRTLAVLVLLLPSGALANSLAEAERAVRERAFERAAVIYRSLAQAGSPEAQYQLASLYRSGKGVEPDATEAVRWLRQSAEAGNADAQYALATMLANGRGTAPDAADAGRWYRAAARQGHPGARRQLQTRPVEPVAALDDQKGLVSAAERGDTSEVLRMVARRSDRAGAALLAAASRGRTETVAVLLSRGADPDHRGAHQEVALHWAARRNDLETLEALLSSGASRDIADDRGATALHAAARAGNLGAVDRLLVHRASGALRDSEGRTALDLAERGRHALVAKRLRRAGAVSRRQLPKVDRRSAALWARESDGSTLTVHARRGDAPAVAALIEAGVSAEDRTAAFREAVAHGQLEVTRLLIDRSLVDPGDSAGRRPLELAARSGSAPVVRLLLGHGARLEDGAPLRAAVAGGHDAVVDVLLGNDGTEREIVNEALRVASTSGEVSIAAALLAAGADPGDPGPGGETAICAAANLPSSRILGRLIAGRSIAGHECQNGVPLLHQAASSPENLRFLLEAGENPNHARPDGTTPLLVAAGQGNDASVRILLQAGAKVDHFGPRRRTAMMVAAERGHEAVVDLLIQARAKVRLRDRAGDTASDLAARAGYERIESKLEAVPAKPWF
jgi:ankyrin repeat protein